MSDLNSGGKGKTGYRAEAVCPCNILNLPVVRSVDIAIPIVTPSEKRGAVIHPVFSFYVHKSSVQGEQEFRCYRYASTGIDVCHAVESKRFEWGYHVMTDYAAEQHS